MISQLLLVRLSFGLAYNIAKSKILKLGLYSLSLQSQPFGRHFQNRWNLLQKRTKIKIHDFSACADPITIWIDLLYS